MGQLEDKYLSIEIKGEKNIGVIRVNALTAKEKAKYQVVKPKLIEALESHFDCPVKIVSCSVDFDDIPLKGEAYVLIESDGGDQYENIVLSQTWVY